MWKVQQGETYGHEVYDDDDGAIVARVVTPRKPSQTKARQAEALRRANVIAAAPELMEALREIVEQFERTRMSVPADLADSIRVFGKAALAKAEGK